MGRKLPLALLAGIAAAIAIGVTAIMMREPASAEAGETLRLLPADTLAYLSLDTDPTSRQWAQAVSLLDRLGVDDFLRTERDDSLAFVDLTWAELAPFLGGELTVAATPGDGSMPGVLVVLSAQDAAKAEAELLRMIEEEADGMLGQPETRTHRGAQIRLYPGGPTGDPIALTRSGRFVIAASSEDLVTGTLDRAAGAGTNLTEDAHHRSARGLVANDALLSFYIRPNAIQDTLQSALSMFSVLGMMAGDLPAQQQDTAEAVIVALSAERTGFRFDARATGVDGMALPRMPEDSTFTRRVPADALVYFGGANLYQSIIKPAFDAVRDVSSNGGMASIVGAEALDKLEDLNRQLAVNLERDLLTQITGEYGAALGVTSVANQDVWVVAGSGIEDRASVTRVLDAIAAWEGREGRNVTASRNGQDVIFESQPGPGDTGDAYAYGLAGNDLLFGLDARQFTASSKAGKYLADDPAFREALTTLGKDRTHTLYVNTGRLIELLRAEFGHGDSVDVDWTALERLRYIAGSFTVTNDSAGGSLFIRVGGE